jgi:hypothetical protein
MASTARKQPVPAQPGIGRFLPVETFKEARNLAGRLQGSDVFRHYVTRRMRLVLPAIVLFLAVSVACTAASIVYIGGTRSSLLVLMALIFAPVILLGSLFVQFHVFFSWLEGRALARAYPHSTKPVQGPLAAWLARKLKADLGTAPRIPWVVVTFFLFAPLVVLALVSAKFALALVAAEILLPILYARLDRGVRRPPG